MDQQTLNDLVLKYNSMGMDIITQNFDELFDHFSSEMPYGTAKAIDGDPYEWLNNKFDKMLTAVKLNWAMTDTTGLPFKNYIDSHFGLPFKDYVTK